MSEASIRLSEKERWSYGFGVFGQSAIYVLISSFLLYFLTDIAGIAAAAVGTLLLITRFLDALDDPIQGYLCDKTRTKWGKYRPWLFITPFLTGITTVLMFSIPSFSTTGKLIFMYVTYILYGIFYSAYDIPFFSMIPALTSDPHERTRIVMPPRILGFIGAMFAAVGTLPLVKVLGGGNEALGFQIFSIILSVIFIITGLITFYNTRERVSVPVKKGEKFSDSLFVIFKNGPLLLLLFSSLSLAVAAAVRGGVALYYFKYNVGNDLLISVYSLASAVVSLVAMMFAPMISKKLGKKRTNILGICIMLTNFVVSYFIPYSMPVLFIVVNAISGFGFGIFNIVITSMVADTVEYAEWKIGKRSESIVFSVVAFITKASTALGGSAVAFSLAFYNFVPNAVQSEQTLNGIRALISLWPALITLIALGLIFFYKITEEKYAMILQDLETRRKENQAQI